MRDTDQCLVRMSRRHFAHKSEHPFLQAGHAFAARWTGARPRLVPPLPLRIAREVAKAPAVPLAIIEFIQLTADLHRQSFRALDPLSGCTSTLPGAGIEAIDL